MKKKIAIIGGFLLLILGIPLISVIGNQGENPPQKTSTYVGITNQDYEIKRIDTYHCLIEETGKVVALTPKEYIVGCLFASIPAGFEQEMLKVQSVVANTYGILLYRNKDNYSSDDLKGADFSNDADRFQGYFTPEQAKEYYGDQYEVYLEKITKAAEFGEKYALVYNNQLIFPAYHSISSGKTEEADVIFGESFPYLVSASSPNDLLSPDYNGSKQLATPTVYDILINYDENIKLGDKAESWFSSPKYSVSGTLISVKVGGKTLTGAVIKELFALRSPAIEISLQDGTFIFFTKGYGHNVGLSIYGGNQMARQGKSADEILSHYYKDIKAVEIK